MAGVGYPRPLDIPWRSAPIALNIRAMPAWRPIRMALTTLNSLPLTQASALGWNEEPENKVATFITVVYGTQGIYIVLKHSVIMHYLQSASSTTLRYTGNHLIHT